jgi:hypothetical protein
MIFRPHHLIALLVALPLIVMGCGSSDTTGADGGLDGGDPNGDNDGGDVIEVDGEIGLPYDPDAGGIEVPTPDGGTRICYPAPCDGRLRECGDCIDNDGDGYIDDEDPNCMGPCDNNEAGLEPNIDGSPLSGCNRDCYFDKDSGSGNDGCEWELQCDPLTPVLSCCDPEITDNDGCERNSWEKNCTDTEEQINMCLEVCEVLTPNGCDCFGCCDIRTDADPTVENWIYLGSFDETQSGTKVGTCTMDLAKAGDHDACRPCTPNAACGRACGECQLCVGMSPDDLPDHCFESDPGEDGGTPIGDRCRDGQQPCGLEGDDPCPQGFFCLTGCCIYVG